MVDNKVEDEEFLGFDEDKEQAPDFKRILSKPMHFNNYELYVAYCLFQSEEWRIAIHMELDAHKKFKTWVEADSPNDVESIETRWIFSTKPDGTKKAQLVAKGFQKNSPEDNKGLLYSPVAKIPSIRLAISYSLQKNWTVKQMDIPTAFLNGTREEDVYVFQPEGVEGKNKVENILLICKKSMTEELAKRLRDKFGANDMGDIQCFVGTEVKKVGTRVELCQHKLNEKMLEWFHAEECNI
ncbi:hypothetical protein PR048_005387 [Dryococelus australis]|uniref:Reverse transcriptase Ty1/copia-type domain-containing protein n=1 Tax=Dryococelus australis TaxID=614101 RepID=A0ABQ9I907_9NEOP|nr:hypothetical protein PR048_005387 [Dryococelus australis]